MVYEDREHESGRQIPLYVRVIPAASSPHADDPLVFVSAGGPGTTNSDLVNAMFARPWRQDRDVVMIDLRGTSGPNRLDCEVPGSDSHPTAFLTSEFAPDIVRRCRGELEQRADLRFYRTKDVIGDLHEVIVALGYKRVNLWGASGGTREVLEFMRAYPAIVRSAILAGVVPVSFKNPLPHAAAAQEALDSLLAQCAADSKCEGTFPDLRAEFAGLRDSLSRRPAQVRVPSQLHGEDSTIAITWPMFAEVIRRMSYAPTTERSIPLVVHRAAQGDFDPLILVGVQLNRRSHASIRLGFLLSQTCTEDVPRISESDIAPATADTYMGAERVRSQKAACDEWPRGATTPADFAPVRSTVPTLLFSGTIDPVTRPAFGAEAARTLSNSVHVIAPGGHVPNGPCIDAIERQFLASASPQNLDLSCVPAMRLPEFRYGLP